VPGAESDTEVQGLYMQIVTPGAPSADDEEECTTLTLVLPADATAQASANGAEEAETETPTQQLYGAVSACANLHPDPVEPGDEDEEDEGPKFISAEEHEGVFQLGDGGMPPPVDGSSGWITADNMDQFFDADGNWIAGGEPPSFPLGPGAGTVRAREEEGENGAAENGEEDDETKWRKTD
jgi:nucleotide-sensitive chloride channel 1A